MKKPEALTEVDIEKIIKSAQSYIDFVSSENYETKYLEIQQRLGMVFKDTLEAVFGEEVWDYVYLILIEGKKND
jgi:hypothetical protein